MEGEPIALETLSLCCRWEPKLHCRVGVSGSGWVRRRRPGHQPRRFPESEKTRGEGAVHVVRPADRSGRSRGSTVIGDAHTPVLRAAAMGVCSCFSLAIRGDSTQDNCTDLCTDLAGPANPVSLPIQAPPQILWNAKLIEELPWL